MDFLPDFEAFLTLLFFSTNISISTQAFLFFVALNIMVGFCCYGRPRETRARETMEHRTATPTIKQEVNAFFQDGNTAAEIVT